MMLNTENASAAVIKLGVAVLIEDSTGGLLLDLRRDCGLWGLPGGRVERGESIEAAALRETREETGFDIRLTGLQGVYSEPADRIVTYTDNGDVRHLVDVAVRARITGGQPAWSQESIRMEFFPRNRLPAVEAIARPARQIVQDYLQGATGVIR